MKILAARPVLGRSSTEPLSDVCINVHCRYDIIILRNPIRSVFVEIDNSSNSSSNSNSSNSSSIFL
jgi:hypothetical protein